MEIEQTESVVADGQEPMDQSCDFEEQDGSGSSSDSLEGAKSSCSPDFEDTVDSELEENQVNEHLEGSHIIEDTVDSELPSNSRDGDSSLAAPRWLEGDESVALWVKWRGRWQVGIRCSRADWPLSTVRGKPTHDRKKYFVIFFPHTRNYSWADTLLVRPISDYPHPIAYRTHKSGLKLVRDMSIARRFIMKKLAVGMLNIIDQFHMEALIESARDVKVWKEFAMEASQCNGYSDLGKMLLKLQNMILRKFINSGWLEQSSDSWTSRCQSAETAELIERLKEELYDSILWNEVKTLWDAPVQPVVSPDHRTWKQEMMKWFSTSNPVSVSSSETGLQNNNGPGPVIPDLHVARKRPKLEIRRAETHTSPLEPKIPPTDAVVEMDTDFFKSQDSATPQPCLGGQPTASPSSVTERWDEIAVEGGNVNNKLATPEPTRMNQLVVRNPIESGSRSRQCAAFIESKGRQCVRSANEGDVYCCVHLASRFLGSSGPRAERAGPDAPMCEGTTVLGTRCKHRSLPGYTFCKKHRPRDDSRGITGPSENIFRKKPAEFDSNLESPYSKALVVVGPVENSLDLEERPEHSGGEFVYGRGARCIGSGLPDETGRCMESPKRYSLYCDTHLPSWLKRARNGKSRIVSKEVFIELLRECYDERQKINLHKACELFFRLFKSVLSLRNPVPTEVQLQWAISEALKEPYVGNFLLKLVSREKERLQRIWGFGGEDGGGKVTPLIMEERALVPWSGDANGYGTFVTCKICSEDFLDDQALGTHWMESHRKEAQWLFRGYACAICLDSYTNKKVLESHVQERHHVQFVEQCKLLQCIPCRGHFGNAEELWAHVISAHPSHFRLSGVAQRKIHAAAEESPSKTNPQHLLPAENNNNAENVRKFMCRFCGLKFDLLPDLGRHHQAAHMGPGLASSRPTKKGIRYYAYKLKSGRLSRPKFKKGLASTSYRIRNRGSTGSLKKRMQVSKSLTSMLTGLQAHNAAAGTANHGRLTEPQCSTIAKILFSQIQKTKPRPSNQDILSVARSACCKERIKATLEAAFGELPERLYLKAAKLCSEQNIPVNWHLEGFICPNGCTVTGESQLSSPLVPPLKGNAGHGTGHPLDHSDDDEWEEDEGHYILDSHLIKSRTLHNAIILCGDISFGRESAPVACVVDEWLLDSLHTVGSDGHNRICSMPWESFTYVTKPLVDQSVGLDTESHQLGCACRQSVCSPGACDHVYLFDNDYEDAKDIYGKSMRGRFPYDRSGRIILEEGYLVYECNHLCSCSKACPNRILQNGVQVKLEVFKTEKKGWGLRAGESIPRGTFISEYVGEVIDEPEGDKRRDRYGEGGCSYLYDINSQINDISRLIEGQIRYVIDSTKYGNVSRFINHSCSPNLMNHQVLVESMDCQRAHIGLYASRDISVGEELTYDYRYELLPGGHPCHCESQNFRGRLY